MSLTAQKLTGALKDNKSYKGVQPFLDEISKGNQEIIQVINPVFVDILNSDKVQLMSKLLVLRMFKDIFLLGNMSLFDGLDPEIQEVIISAAAYNPNFRPKGKNDKQTRGGMYFVDAEKRQKNTQTIQLSNSFVLLATQIVKHLALWFPENPDKTSSRFFQAYQQLENLGVPFDTNIYFQPQQQQTFNKNYQNWLQKNQGTKLEKQQKLEKQNKKQQKNKQSSKKIQEHKQQKLGFLESLLATKPQSQTDKKKQKIKQSSAKISLQQQNVLLQKNNEKQIDEKNLQIKSLLEQIKSKESETNRLQQQILRRCEQNSQLNKGIAKLQQQQSIIKKQIQQKDERIEMLEKNNKNLQSDIKRITTIKNDAMEKIENMQKLIQQMKQEKNQVIRQLQSEKQNSQTKNNVEKQGSQNLQKLKIELQKYKNKYLKLQKQNEELNSKQTEYQTKINDFQKVIQGLKNQKSQLLDSLKQLQLNKMKPINQQGDDKKQKVQIKNECIIQKKQQKQIIPQSKQNFLLEQEQQKSGTANKHQSREFDEVIAEQKQNLNSTCQLNKKQNSMSLSKFLGLKSPEQFEETFNYRTNSINNTFCRTADNFQHKRSKNSLHKTQTAKLKSDWLHLKETNNTFFNKTQQEPNVRKLNYRVNKNIVTSVFPFIQQYFSPIKLKGSEQFRLCCLMQEARRFAFFSDQILELKLIKPKQNAKSYQISIKNKLPQSIDVNLSSDNSSLRVKQMNCYSKIQPFNEIRLGIQCSVTDLNFRVPICCLNVLIDKKQYKYNLPLPITLFSFVQLSQSQKQFEKFERYNQNEYKKHRSEKFLLNKSIKSFPIAFPQLTFGSNSNGTLEAASILTYPQIPQIKLKLNLIQSKQTCQFETQFVTSSKISEAFSKVILQILMFMVS